MQPKGLFKFLRLEGFYQNVLEYVENRIAIAKLEAKQKVADIASTVIAMVPAALFGLFALTFLSLALAQAINVWLDSEVWGFVIVGVIYGIAAYAMFSMRDSVWLKKKIVDGSTKFLKEKPANQDNDAADQAYAQQTATVEHKKIVFEDTEVPAVTETDRDYLKDREPISRVNGTTGASNATIIVESDTDIEEKRTS